MKSAQEWFDAYGVSHQNKINKLIHWVCIPIIVLSLFGMFMSIPVPNGNFSWFFNFGSLVLLFTFAFYLRLSWSLSLGMLLMGTLMILINYYLFGILGSQSALALVSLALFVIAWIGQFIGHKIEGEKPSFFEDLQFLMIGPAWLLQFIYKKIGLSI